VADLTDLARDLREQARHAVPPAFDTLVDEARARRRHRVRAGAAAVVLLAVSGGAAVVTRTGPDSAPPPTARPTGTTPGPARSDAAGRLRALSAAQIVRQGSLETWAAGDGRVLTVWRACVRDGTHCRFAWHLGSTNGLTGSGDRGPDVVAAEGGFVLTAGTATGLLVRDDGTAARLVPVDSLASTAGDVVVRSDRGPRLVDPRTARSGRLTPPAGSDGLAGATATPDGTVWALPAWSGPGRVEVARLRDGTWRSHPVDDPSSTAEVPAFLAVAGDRVAALSSYDGATVAPVGVLAVSTDDGSTWTHLARGDVPFAAVDSMAATDDGVLVVAEPDGTVWRSTDATWRSFARVTGAGRVGGLVPAGAGVLGRAAGATDRLVLVDGAGTARPVPAR